MFILSYLILHFLIHFQMVLPEDKENRGRKETTVTRK